MIKIEISRSTDETKITINGHANYAKSGYDIVCSAVSALFQTLCLAEKKQAMADSYFELSSGYSSITISHPDCTSEILTDAFLTGVENIAEIYPSNVKLYEVKER